MSTNLRIRRNKTSSLPSIALILLLASSVLMTTMPTANAAKTWPTFIYISVAPNPVGVNQDVLVYAWLRYAPFTAVGPYGDRWHGMTVEVTAPDGTKQTLGPSSSDPVGGTWWLYTPTKQGTYKFQASFAGQTLAGENLHPTDKQGREFIGDYFEPSTSRTLQLTVQADPIATYPDSPLPSGYWTRPINAQHRDWWSISGNFLGPVDRMIATITPYTKAPDTAHILWAKPLATGGLVGGEHGATSYFVGEAYEGKWSPPIIMNGRLFYNLYPGDAHIASLSPNYTTRPLAPGFVAVDLRTGEEIWRNNDDRISFGQIYMFDSPNEHGAMTYLWSVTGTTWKAYDPFDGKWVFTIENVPAAATRAQIHGAKGEILRYVVDTTNGWLALWNNTAIPRLVGAPPGLERAWLWRPYGKTVDGRTGYSWNVTIPTGLTGSIYRVLVDENGNPDRVIGGSGFGMYGYHIYLPTENFTLWTVNLKPKQEGQLLWKKFSDNPIPGATLSIDTFPNYAPASMEDGVLTLFSMTTRQWLGYSIDTGEKIWGPTEPPQDDWDSFYETSGAIAYGKLYSAGPSGILYCYDVKTGALKWTYAAHDPTWESMYGGNYPVRLSNIADGKVYIMSTEHSPNNPMPRNASIWCVNAETGALVWTLPFRRTAWEGVPAIADGILVNFNTYDNRIYALGKGQTAVTVTVQNDVISKGNSVLIKGSVTDQSPDVKGTPAIADEDMTEWMKYLYMQFEIPSNAKGVDVLLTAIDPNGNAQEIGTVTSDMSGMFKKLWTPTLEGEYTIVATFAGSNAYYASYSETAIGVTAIPAASPSAPQTSGPTATPTTPSTPIATASPSVVPTMPGTGSSTEIYIGIAAAVIIIAVVAIAIFLRRRK